MPPGSNPSSWKNRFFGAGMSIQPKRIYIAERNRALSREQFIARWRRHGVLAMSFMASQNWGNVIRYVHCDAMHERAIPGVSDQYDGMGIVLFKDPEARKRHIDFTQARAALELDEEETFKARMKFGLGTVTREEIRLDGPVAGVKMVYCYNIVKGLKNSDGSSGYPANRAGEVMRIFKGSLRRYTQSFALIPENGVSWGLKSDVIEELWFDSVETARKAYARSEAQDFQANRTGLAQKPLIILVKELVLYPYPTSVR